MKKRFSEEQIIGFLQEAEARADKEKDLRDTGESSKRYF